ncbi:MAG: CPXCG motif-containing cysteine-rich protein [Proteobacteria bacterium]|nr:CPXCG motif-containing cysteine-rich protein [Pseudomonadota bacterium]MDA1064276.1 CPXCG motif-containing cysteine-rich protein [Pseudomonadota bacterium]
MSDLLEQYIACPYCGEGIVVLVDESVPDQTYVEDCQVCCRPIVIETVEDIDGNVALSARSEND